MMHESDELEMRVDRAFGLLAFTVNRHLVEHMRRLAQELNMDFASAYIYGILAHMNVAPILSPGAHPDEYLEQSDMGRFNAVPVRLTDVAQVSGLPRETVRRKLESLQKLGKVERTNEGLWCYSRSGVDERIIKFTKETILRFLKTADEMQATLKMVDLSNY